ncbi:cobalt transporter [Methylopila jiangsuensis]|uniref:Cobalt transporter n=1 Tax=Methylopila jiangsuensis TaxID=586230 RepID=A0A9W6JCC9_9HYPH|nr:cation diffusion facilitator family transporter [Methylopila jiangsuensis]MDR6287389.1 cobalt-zinc-cadmium efflux system protein [Methylopila jiangsuensis]GLK74970.1 cobalt transporter [Methylopila jiangsuensis]
MTAHDDHAGHDHGGEDHSGHSHGPGGHSHAPTSFGKAFAIGIGLNTVFVVIEAGYGYASNSLALVADAGHNLSDVLGLVVAWIAATLASRPPSPRFSYGLRSSSIMAALFNAIFLLIAVGMITWEAIQRFFDPQPVAGVTVMVVAAIGVLINGFTAFLFMSGRKGDINIKGAYLHMVADAGVSVAVIVAGLLVIVTGWEWLDPVVSLMIAAVITIGTWGLLRDSVTMSLDATPPGIDPAAVAAFLQERPGVIEVHDLHVWPMSTTETALTAHLVMPSGHPGDAAMRLIAQELEERFGIAHPTIQIELSTGSCPLAPAHAV